MAQGWYFLEKYQFWAMKYFLHLSYKGTNYHGWQHQPKHPSIQETLEDALAKMVGYKVNCIGCGRTDAGVHASQYFCHIKLLDALDYDLVFRLNKMLPDDIVIHRLIPVHWEAHAQKDALSRTYTFRIHTKKDAFRHELSAYYPGENLNIALMEKALALLTKYQDFHSFCRQPLSYKNTICKLSIARLVVENNSVDFRFEFTADRFLRGMVRLLVAALLEVGYGRETLAQFEASLKFRNKRLSQKAAYPQGLYLTGVAYSYIN
jgi:tRNA pseudouridine38-40 synthase